MMSENVWRLCTRNLLFTLKLICCFWTTKPCLHFFPYWLWPRNLRKRMFWNKKHLFYIPFSIYCVIFSEQKAKYWRDMVLYIERRQIWIKANQRNDVKMMGFPIITWFLSTLQSWYFIENRFWEKEFLHNWRK